MSWTVVNSPTQTYGGYSPTQSQSSTSSIGQKFSQLGKQLAKLGETIGRLFQACLSYVKESYAQSQYRSSNSESSEPSFFENMRVTVLTFASQVSQTLRSATATIQSKVQSTFAQIRQNYFSEEAQSSMRATLDDWKSKVSERANEFSEKMKDLAEQIKEKVAPILAKVAVVAARVASATAAYAQAVYDSLAEGWSQSYFKIGKFV